MAQYYRDIQINKGDDYSEVIDISVPFDEYDFTGVLRSSVASPIGVPFTFEEVDGNLRKMRISLSSELTSTLRRRRGVYSILATNKITQDVFTEREGIAHYSQAPSFVPAAPPPPNYVVNVENIEGLGTAATADAEDFATAEQGDLADSALQAESVSSAPVITELSEDKAFLLKGNPLDALSWSQLKTLLKAHLDQFYSGGIRIVQSYEDLFFAEEAPEFGDPAYIVNDEKFVRFSVMPDAFTEGRVGHTISGFGNPAYDGKYALVGFNEGRNYYYSEHGITLRYDEDLQRFVFIDDNSNQIAYSSVNSYSYPFAFELTWYLTADDSVLPLVFEDLDQASYYSWQVDVPDLVPNFQSGLHIRNENGWFRVPDHLIPFFESWDIDGARSSIGVIDPVTYIYRAEWDAINSANFLGKAPTGTLENEDNWQITRILFATDGSVISSETVQNIAWTNRSSIGSS